jgi:hypothetical protein
MPLYWHDRRIPLPKGTRGGSCFILRFDARLATTNATTESRDLNGTPNLETRTARSRLKARHKPCLRLIEPGIHVGLERSWHVGCTASHDLEGNGVHTVKNLRTRR